ncbi:hypothetical protein [Bacillus alkalicellulosilyticus]|uniref:hypothetical protein n=1 Tax=Alkalihalobacterium alkalicellulosilyticum TaxID=1912214 RepID=UPI000997FD60|nr:hypothetical protein [Bacillus alkalicellulosilyticus]
MSSNIEIKYPSGHNPAVNKILNYSNNMPFLKLYFENYLTSKSRVVFQTYPQYLKELQKELLHSNSFIEKALYRLVTQLVENIIWEEEENTDD